MDSVTRTSPTTTLPRGTTGPRRSLKRAWREAGLAYLFLLPSFVLIIVFGLWPVVRAGYISLHHWSIVKGNFIWFENYRELFNDPAFWKALQVTVFYVVATVPLTMLLSLVIAYLLFKPIRYRGFFRTLYFLPYVTSLVPAAMVWQWIFNSQSGILNYISDGALTGVAWVCSSLGHAPVVYVWALAMVAWIVYVQRTKSHRSSTLTILWTVVAAALLALATWFMLRPDVLDRVVAEMTDFFPVRWLQEPRGIFLYLGKRWGFTPPKWLQGPSMALIAVSVMSMWHFTGYDVVIYLAGLFNISPELYDAARIDGANEWQVFWRITFPMLSPTTFFLLIISTIGAFRAFTMFYIMTDGGPLSTTTSVTFLIYDRFYNAARWGYASAIAFVLFGIILAMTLLNNRIAGRRVTYQ